MKAKHVFVTLGLSLVMGLGVAAGLSHTKGMMEAKATTHDYFFNTNGQGDLQVGNERFGAWVWKDSGAGTWKAMTETSEGSGIYSVNLDAETYNKVIFARLDKNYDLDWSHKWHQTGNLDLGETYFYYRATAVAGGDITGEWYTPVVPVDPSEEKNTFTILDEYQVLGDDPTEINVYGFGQDEGINPMAWPGNGGVEDFPTDVLPTYRGQVSISYPKIVLNNGTDQTVDIEDFDTNYGSKVLNILNTKTDGKYNYEWVDLDDIDRPAQQGYYFSIDPNWGYDDAIEMVTASSGENAAYLMNYHFDANDTIRVRSYWTDRHPFDQFADVGGTETFSEKVGDNLKIKTAGDYDIYAKYDKEDGNKFKFYVAEHVDNYEITMTGVLFEGKAKITTAALGTQIAYSTSNFDPELPARAGYAAKGVFTDEDCETAYVPAKLAADGELFVKYMRLGYYMAGDDAFSGGEGKGWKVENSPRLQSENLADPDNNKVEGAFVIPEGASSESPVKVKPLNYNGTGWDAVTYDVPLKGSDAYNKFMKEDLDENGNLQFIKEGTYYLYLNKDNDIYLSEGAQAFYSKFLSEVGAVCSGIENETKVVADLQAIWGEQEDAYNSLSAAEKATIVAAEFGTEHEETDDLARMLNKYSRIVSKYGLVKFKDFIFGQDHLSNVVNPVANNSNTMLLVVVITTVSLVSVAGLFLVIRRRKHQ